MAGYASSDTPRVLIERYASLNDADRRDAINTLSSRPAYAIELLRAIKGDAMPREALTAFVVRQMHTFADPTVNDLLADVWGNIRETSEDKKQLIAQYTQLLTPERLKLANLSEGRVVYANTCQACHKLYGEGTDLGPDLTGSNRADLTYVLENILDPNAVVGKDYQMTIVQLKDGRVVSGMVKSETDSAVTVQLLNEQNVVAKADIVKRETLPMSMMPEGQLTALSDEQAVNLVAYLASRSQVLLPGQKIAPRPQTGRVLGALEGEDLTVEQVTHGKTSRQSMGSFSGDKWSNKAQLFWTGAQPGASLSVIFPKRTPGVVELQLVLTKAPDYPIIQLHLNGDPLGAPIDLYSEKVETTGLIPLGAHDLPNNWQNLTLEIVGSNPLAKKAYRVGIDYLRMVPVR
jgi:putative heme-binding domain-containing protein